MSRSTLGALAAAALLLVTAGPAQAIGNVYTTAVSDALYPHDPTSSYQGQSNGTGHAPTVGRVVDLAKVTIVSEPGEHRVRIDWVAAQDITRTTCPSCEFAIHLKDVDPAGANIQYTIVGRPFAGADRQSVSCFAGIGKLCVRLQILKFGTFGRHFVIWAQTATGSGQVKLWNNATNTSNGAAAMVTTRYFYDAAHDSALFRDWNAAGDYVTVVLVDDSGMVLHR